MPTNQRELIPGHLRVHLVMNNAHVGYVILSDEDWNNFLDEQIVKSDAGEHAAKASGTGTLD